MKNYKNIAYTLVAVSLMAFFAATQVIAEGYKQSENNRILSKVVTGYSVESVPNHGNPVFINSPAVASRNPAENNGSDFINGENTGAQVASENQSCPVPGVQSVQEASIAKDQYADSHMTAGLSNDFVNGFWKGYERTRSSVADVCR